MDDKKLHELILKTVSPVNEDMGAIAHGIAMGVGAVGVGTAVGVASSQAHKFLADKWNHHKTRQMFKKTFAPGAKVTLNGTQGSKEGSIVSHDKESGKFHVQWHDGTSSSHHAGNDEAEHEEPQIMPKEWKH